MVTAPEENQYLVREPYDLKRPVRQLMDVSTQALEMLMRQWEVEGLRVAIGGHYSETVGPGDLPTNDFIDGSKRDLDTHGKTLVTIHPFPAPEGYDPRTGFQMMVTGVVERGKKLEVVAMLFSAELLRRTREMARAVNTDPE